MSEDPTPTSDDVIRYLNGRFEELGLSYRVEHIAVLPYMNPRWMANWELGFAVLDADRDLVERELAEARWLYPQVRDTL